MSDWTDVKRRRSRKEKWYMRAIIVTLFAVACAVLNLVCGCVPIPSTAGPSPKRDYPTAVTPGKPIIATIEQIKPNEAAVKAGGSEARKAAETGLPFLSNLIEPLDNLPLITFIIQGARVAEALIDQVSKAQVTRVKIEVPTDNGMPASMVVTPESITVTWPDGSTATAVPEPAPDPNAVPAVMADPWAPFDADALMGNDK